MTGQWEPDFHVPADVYEIAQQVRLVLFDVDGVLTDGALYIDDEGTEIKRFHVHDGHGLKVLRRAGLEIGFITARTSAALHHRLADLGICRVLSGQTDKLKAAREMTEELQLDLSQCCYTGDDWVDIPLMLECGLAIAVNNANEAVKRVAHWVTPRSGGDGAVRNVCELLLYAQSKLDDVMGDYFRRATE